MSYQTSVAVCSVATSENKHEKFITFLRKELDFTVEFETISGIKRRNRIDFSRYDAAILIHSVDNGRFSLSDVNDARYEEFFKQLEPSLDKERVALVITGVTEKQEIMKRKFLETQFTAARCSATVHVCDRAMDVKGAIKSFLDSLGKRPNSPKRQPLQTGKQRSGTDEERNAENKQVKAISATLMEIEGDDLEVMDTSDVDFIICADGSTRETLLSTLKKMSKMELADFKIYLQEEANRWNRVQYRNGVESNPESRRTQCAVLIYRDNAPTALEDVFRTLKENINEPAITSYIDVQGDADDECRLELMNCMAKCSSSHPVATVTPRENDSNGMYSENWREMEHKMEVMLKEKVRDYIKSLKKQSRSLEGEISDLIVKKFALTKEVKELKSDREKENLYLENLREDTRKIEQRHRQLQQELKKGGHSKKPGKQSSKNPSYDPNRPEVVGAHSIQDKNQAISHPLPAPTEHYVEKFSSKEYYGVDDNDHNDQDDSPHGDLETSGETSQG